MVSEVQDKIDFTEMFDLDITKSTLFLLPLLKDLINLGKKKITFTTFLINEVGLTNCFINDNIEIYDYCLYLAFNKEKALRPILKSGNEMISLDTYFSGMENCLDVYEAEDVVVYVYKLDEEFYQAYDWFKNSEYSKLRHYASYYSNPDNDVLLDFTNKVIHQDNKLASVIKEDLLIRKNVSLNELLNKIDESELKIEKKITNNSINKIIKFLKRCV